MVSEGKDAVILFTMAKETSPYQAALTFATNNKARVISTDAVNINGLPSQRLLSDVQSQKEVIRVLSYFIQRGKEIFVFHGLATSLDLFQKHGSIFDGTMRNFRELTDPRRINVRPDRIRIRIAGTTDRLENLLRSFGIPNEKVAEVAVLNGRDLKEFVPSNTLLKVVERREE